VLRDCFVKPSHLQQQLRVRVVGVRIVGDEFDVFLERVFSVAVRLVLSIGITENVVSRGIVGGDLGCSFVLRDCVGVFLLTKVIAAEIEVRAFVVWISGDELVENLFLLRRISVGASFG